MAIYLLSFGVASSRNKDGKWDDGEERRGAAYSAAFQLGLAWHGGQSAIFVRTDKTLDQVVQRVLLALDDRDLLVALEIDERTSVAFAGLRFDEESFDEIFPNATELKHCRRSPSD